jgi:hypothetical protein
VVYPLPYLAETAVFIALHAGGGCGEDLMPELGLPIAPTIGAEGIEINLRKIY